jgi:hypothetical protein
MSLKEIQTPLVQSAKAETSKFVEKVTPQAQEGLAAAASAAGAAVDSVKQVLSVCELMHEGGADELAGPDGERRNDGGGEARRGFQPTCAPCGCFRGGGERSGRSVAGGEQAGSKEISEADRAKLIDSQESAQQTSEESQADDKMIPLVETAPKSHAEGPVVDEAAEVCTTGIRVTSRLLTVDAGCD